MNELFADVSNWENVATKNWKVAGGQSLGLGAILGAEAKIMSFTHGDLNSKKAFVMTSVSAGFKLEAEFGIGWVDKLLSWGGYAQKVSDTSGVSPLNFSPPQNIRAKRPFSIKDLRNAKGVSGSVGATGGVVDTGVELFTFHRFSDDVQLFTMDDATVRMTLGAGINMGSLRGSILVDLQHPPNEKYFQDTGSKKGQWYHSGGKI